MPGHDRRISFISTRECKMTSKFGWRETASAWLCGILLVCLLFALAGEAVDLAWLRQPLGMIAWNVADVFGWLFAVVLIAPLHPRRLHGRPQTAPARDQTVPAGPRLTGLEPGARAP